MRCPQSAGALGAKYYSASFFRIFITFKLLQWNKWAIPQPYSTPTSQGALVFRFCHRAGRAAFKAVFIVMHSAAIAALLNLRWLS
jgi:hypothetical protein